MPQIVIYYWWIGATRDENGKNEYTKVCGR